ncbi:hypothetical protein FHS59_003589 [Algoriphagus iocasae]|uniref:Uncharacterized protein n=1 Tax=Algoriphagus iocasae TaxID=1836499 RepID=A0A841MV38_9BACT|nr:hypothetical protein [Algoriphagus iocasae]
MDYKFQQKISFDFLSNDPWFDYLSFLYNINNI